MLFKSVKIFQIKFKGKVKVKLKLIGKRKQM